MGYEGFSKSLHVPRMDPIYGNRREFLFLLALFLVTPLLKGSRIKNEDVLRDMLKTTNRYAELPLDAVSRQPSAWTL